MNRHKQAVNIEGLARFEAELRGKDAEIKILEAKLRDITQVARNKAAELAAELEETRGQRDSAHKAIEVMTPVMEEAGDRLMAKQSEVMGLRKTIDEERAQAAHERQEPGEPPVTPETTGVLLRAADRVKKGWCQVSFTLGNPVVRWSAIGAIHAEYTESFEGKTYANVHAIVACERLLANLGEQGSLPSYNDARGRTAAEVAHLLRGAALEDLFPG